MEKDAPIFVAGHRGLVGSAIVRKLHADGHTRVLTCTRAQLDLCDQRAVDAWFARERPAYVFLAAAKVGGIHANNSRPAEFIRDNLIIQCNVIHAAHQHGARKLEFLGSSCIYPKLAPQPMKEEHLLTGPLEPTNAPYAIAKIAGIEMCDAYRRQYGLNAISLMPTNLYGPNDNFDLESSHVLPALIRKFHEAKVAEAATVSMWGSGSPRREFLHVDDLAAASVFLMNSYDGREIVNVGVGEDVTIRELGEMVRDVVGFTGRIEWDPSKPDGTPRKLLDVSRINGLGWRAKIPLREGIACTYAWLREHELTPASSA
ncbi:MAG: GDP-L-fucose synthase [Planctomycetes bacterium]|nr:GDP-L-fucose synthase [Planctomycetota bacterium]